MTRLERDVWVAALAAAYVARKPHSAREAAAAVLALRHFEPAPPFTVTDAIAREVLAEVHAFEKIHGGIPSP